MSSFCHILKILIWDLAKKLIILIFLYFLLLGDFFDLSAFIWHFISPPFKKSNTFDIFATFVGQLFQEDLVVIKRASFCLGFFFFFGEAFQYHCCSLVRSKGDRVAPVKSADTFDIRSVSPRLETLESGGWVLVCAPDGPATGLLHQVPLGSWEEEEVGGMTGWIWTMLVLGCCCFGCM